MKKIFYAAFICAMLASCQKENKTTTVSANTVSSEVISQIAAQGFRTDDVRRAKGGYFVEGDIFLSDDEVANPEVIATNDIRVAQTEQYSTKYLIRALPRVITLSLSGSTSPNYSAALDSAIARYNALKLRLTFKRVASNGNIAIVFDDLGGATSAGIILGQSAGFPDKAGNPPSPITLNSNPAAYGSPDHEDVQALATVMAHEVGHCIGFRHTDYKDRSYSCGGKKYNERALGFLGVGAVYIPGTPTGGDPNSWMLACVNGWDTNRPFNPNDVTALKYLYK